MYTNQQKELKVNMYLILFAVCFFFFLYFYIFFLWVFSPTTQ